MNDFDRKLSEINLKYDGATIQIQNHVVSFSGGVGSWATARRVKEKYGTEKMTLLFADTMMEDPDLYRFLGEAALNIGVPVTRICDGRTPWEVYEDVRFIGNSRIDPCSKILKRELIRKWCESNCEPVSTLIHVGIDWHERHRMEAINVIVRPWRYEALMCERTYLSKEDMFDLCGAEGIRIPKLNELGFAHNNCGGFCCKAGHTHFKHLLKTLPEVYQENEFKESRLRRNGIDGTILRLRRKNDTRPITLKEFREMVEAGEDLGEPDDLAAGCGCALPV